MKNNNHTPVIKQYLKIKAKFKDMLVLYRMGDFYEFFFEDAHKASKLLNINLTTRGVSINHPVPMAGIPHYVLNNYVLKLINLGESVVICEQIDVYNNIFINKSINKPKLLPRKVVKVITPGTLTEDYLLSNNKDNLLAALYQDKGIFAYATLDLISGEFLLYCLDNIEKLKLKLNITNPAELLYAPSFTQVELLKNINCIKKRSNLDFDIDNALYLLKQQFGTYDLTGFGIDNNHICLKSAGCLLQYIKDTQHNKLSHVTNIKLQYDKDFLILDKFTIDNLGIINNNKQQDSLISILDKTSTFMGSRLLKRWILHPILNLDIIKNRQTSIKHLMFYYQELQYFLKKINDLERITARLAMLTIKPRDLDNLKQSVKFIPNIKNILKLIEHHHINNLNYKIYTFNDIYLLLNKAIVNNPANSVYDGEIIAKGFNIKLDKLKKIVNNKTKFITNLEKQEQLKLKINNLKIKFNNLHGYYIQINKKQIHLINNKNYIRVQSLKNHDRFITTELKDIERKLLNTKNQIYLLEKHLLHKILNYIRHFLPKLLFTTKALSELDVLTNLSERAKNLNYYLPKFTNHSLIRYSQGRHPIIEYNKLHPFVPNSLLLSSKFINTIILTGPNMGGKSTFLRQTGLIVIMAYIGSYVPAKNVIIGHIDRIFVRLGFTDNPTHGKSTFMVEMNELSNILHNATSNSLVLIDEIGRGTSSKDGISLAWGILFFLNKFIKSFNIFSTHFFELVTIANILPKINNMYFNAIKLSNHILFDYKLKYGFTNKSYGLSVAKLAGLPKTVLKLAKYKLNQLNKNNN